MIYVTASSDLSLAALPEVKQSAECVYRLGVASMPPGVKYAPFGREESPARVEYLPTSLSL